MNAADAAHHWQRIWRQREPGRVSWYEPVPALSLRLIAWAGVPVDRPVVDVGGGASTLVDALLDRGHRDVTVLDIAAAALERTRTRLAGRAPRVHWIVADLRRWRPTRVYGLWHDRAVFHFLVEDAERAAYRAALLAGTGPGSVLLVATFAPDAPPRCSGLPVRRYDAAQLASVFAPEFEPLDSRRHIHTTPAGVVQPFVYLLARRRSGSGTAGTVPEPAAPGPASASPPPGLSAC